MALDLIGSISKQNPVVLLIVFGAPRFPSSVDCFINLAFWVGNGTVCRYTQDGVTKFWNFAETRCITRFLSWLLKSIAFRSADMRAINLY